MPNLTKSELEALHETWKARISDFQMSRQSQREWCAAHHIPVRQLQYWLRKFSNRESKSQSQSSNWAVIQLNESVKDTPSQSALYIRVGSAVIEVRDGFNPSLLLAVVKALQTLC